MITLSNSTTITLPNIRTIVVTTNSLTTVIDYDYYSYERIETIDNMELIRA